MKTILLLMIAVSIATNSIVQQLKQFRINVTLKSDAKNGRGYLKYFTDEGPYVDSVSFSKGEFVFTGMLPVNLTIAKIYILYGKEDKPKNENTCEVWLEEGEIKIIAHGSLMHSAYSGSGIQEQFSELQKNLFPVIKRNFVLDKAYEKAEAEKDGATKNRLLQEDYPALFNEKQKILAVFILKHPSSLISAYKFEEFAGSGEMNLGTVEPVYHMLDSSIKQHQLVIKVAERITINKRTAAGMDAIKFKQTDTSGKQVSLSSFLGKYLLIDFWAGWCMPCRAENPHLVKLYELYNTKGFEILGVSLDGERKRWTDAIVKDKLVWTNVSDLKIFDNAIAKLYGITSIPQNIFINPEGRIIAKNLRGTVLENKLADIFK